MNIVKIILSISFHLSNTQGGRALDYSAYPSVCNLDNFMDSFGHKPSKVVAKTHRRRDMPEASLVHLK